jgi:hypothetical protein
VANHGDPRTLDSRHASPTGESPARHDGRAGRWRAQPKGAGATGPAHPAEEDHRHHGSKRAIVAVGRSILVIAWHLLSDPESRFTDLGPGFYATRIDPDVLTGSIVTSASKPALTWRYA